MAIRSPDAELRRIRDSVRGLASQGFRDEVMKSLAEEARRLIVLSFQRSTSPDGEPWKPLKYRQGMPLLDTGRLRNSIRVTPTRFGIRARTAVVYAATHQYGRPEDGIPARPFLPVGELPQLWAVPFRNAINSAVRRRVHG